MAKASTNMRIMNQLSNMRDYSRMTRLKDMVKCYSETNVNIKGISKIMYSKAKASYQLVNSST